jgi:hypothetical protein
MSQATRWYLATTVLLAGLLCRLAANAPAAETESETRISILAIHATNEEKPHIDPELDPLKDALARSGYNSFRLVAKERRVVGTGDTWERPMLEDYALRVIPTEIAEDRVTLTYAWVHYEKDEQGRRIARVLQQVPMTLIKGKYFVSGGWRLKKGALVGAFAAE